MAGAVGNRAAPQSTVGRHRSLTLTLVSQVSIAQFAVVRSDKSCSKDQSLCSFLSVQPSFYGRYLLLSYSEPTAVASSDSASTRNASAIAPYGVAGRLITTKPCYCNLILSLVNVISHVV